MNSNKIYKWWNGLTEKKRDALLQKYFPKHTTACCGARQRLVLKIHKLYQTDKSKS